MTVSTGERLDPERLDEIVESLDLSEAETLERLRAWYDELLRGFWDWLKSVTGGEDGWLDRAADRVRDWLSGLTGQDDFSGETFLTFMYYGSVAVLIGILLVLGYQVWRAYRPALRPADDASFSYLPMATELSQPLAELPENRWVPAMFVHVCRQLVADGRLRLRPRTTNMQAAAAARIEPPADQALKTLAVAADRALFAGWQPDTRELDDLRALYDGLRRPQANR